jgi:hypothetical protein
MCLYSGEKRRVLAFIVFVMDGRRRSVYEWSRNTSAMLVCSEEGERLGRRRYLGHHKDRLGIIIVQSGGE